MALCRLLLSLLVFASSLSLFSCQLLPVSVGKVVRHANRSAVVPGQFLVQTSLVVQAGEDPAPGAAANLQIQADLAGVLSALTGLGKVLPLGVSVTRQILYSYSTALVGFAVKFIPSPPVTGYPSGTDADSVVLAAVTALASMPGVLLVEEDGVIEVGALASQSVSASNQWNLDRVDQRQERLDQTYFYNTTADQSHAYILDTGLYVGHNDFEGRAQCDFSAFTQSGNPPDCTDHQGHGTHVAGTVGSKTWGVAKKVTLHSVKVLNDDGAGTDSSVAAGLDFLAKNAVPGRSVGVMSLGGSISSALDTGVKNAVSAGVPVVVAAGNQNASACSYSPAHVDTAITVGATTSTQDTRASFSNWGSCVTLFAPGAQITSVSYSAQDGSRVLSGTSMAAPHVAGVVALYLSLYPGTTPAKIKDDLVCFSTKGAVKDAQGSANRFLYSFTGQKSAAAPAATTPAPSDQPPAGNNQNEQCTSSSPCEGPSTQSITVKNGVYSIGFNATVSGFHRAWLAYNTGGGSVLAPQNVNDALFLSKFNTSSGAWDLVASATDSNNNKNIMYEDVAPAGGKAGGLFAWQVQAKGYVPSSFTLTFKKPEAAPPQAPSTPTPSPVDPCSGTTYYDPNPNDPNNIGQNNTPRDTSSGSAAQVPITNAATASAVSLLAAAVGLAAIAF